MVSAEVVAGEGLGDGGSVDGSEDVVSGGVRASKKMLRRLACRATAP